MYFEDNYPSWFYGVYHSRENGDYLDKVAEGKEVWNELLANFYQLFEPCLLYTSIAIFL